MVMSFKHEDRNKVIKELPIIRLKRNDADTHD